LEWISAMEATHEAYGFLVSRTAKSAPRRGQTQGGGERRGGEVENETHGIRLVRDDSADFSGSVDTSERHDRPQRRATRRETLKESNEPECCWRHWIFRRLDSGGITPAPVEGPPWKGCPLSAGKKEPSPPSNFIDTLK
jgi:hypothetical protein